MQVVASRERLLIETQRDPHNIGHVDMGQRLVAKVSIYDFICYRRLERQVMNIGRMLIPTALVFTISGW